MKPISATAEEGLGKANEALAEIEKTDRRVEEVAQHVVPTWVWAVALPALVMAAVLIVIGLTFIK
mgnify:CR=1 FL=1